MSVESDSRVDVQFLSKKTGSWLVLDWMELDTQFGNCWLRLGRFTYSRGQGSDSENQIQLRQVARTRLQRFHAIQILFVGFENGRTMDNWIKRSPFLEENVDELIGHKSRRRLNGLIGTTVGNGRRGVC